MFFRERDTLREPTTSHPSPETTNHSGPACMQQVRPSGAAVRPAAHPTQLKDVDLSDSMGVSAACGLHLLRFCQRRNVLEVKRWDRPKPNVTWTTCFACVWSPVALVAENYDGSVSSPIPPQMPCNEVGSGYCESLSKTHLGPAWLGDMGAGAGPPVIAAAMCPSASAQNREPAQS